MSELDEGIRAQMLEALPRLRRFGYALTGNMHDADDIVQATVERALRSIEQWQHGTRLDSWMFRIAKNLWIDQIRSLKHRGQEVDIESTPELQGDDGETLIESQLMLRKTQKAIMQLPEEQRSVIALVSVDGLSYREVAEILEVPIGTVMSRLARARKILAEQLLENNE